MQPYFFPYVGYFDVIRKTDQWIVFDVVDYKPKSWMNRNRILEPNKGEQYVTVPVDRRSSRRLADVTTVDVGRARDKILRQLGVYRHIAPHYEAVVDLVEGSFGDVGPGAVRLRDLDVAGLSRVCARLGITFDYRICSELDLDFSSIRHAGQWALEICDQLGATHYVNPSGGKQIFRPDEWADRGIGLAFTRLPSLTYDVGRPFRFVPQLSVLDCLMWLDPAEILTYLDSLTLDHDPGAGSPAQQQPSEN